MFLRDKIEVDRWNRDLKVGASTMAPFLEGELTRTVLEHRTHALFATFATFGKPASYRNALLCEQFAYADQKIAYAILDPVSVLLRPLILGRNGSKWYLPRRR
jgi:hypothetical protein